MLPAAMASVTRVIRASGLAEEFPEIGSARAGVYGKPAAVDAILRDGDRVEIYRALQADPKEVRRTRAAKKRAKE